MDDRTIEDEVDELLDAFVHAVQQRDVDDVLELYADDPLAIGTGDDEWYEGVAEMTHGLQRDLAQAEAISLRFEPPRARSAGNTAWFATRVRIEATVDGRSILIAARFTGVLRRVDGSWRFVQTHLSMAASDQPEGRSFPSA